MIKNKILYNVFSNWVFDVSKTKGSYIWDSKGKKYLDFTSGWNVANLGWNQPEIIQAVIKQLKKNTYVPGWTADPIQNKYASLLINSLPGDFGTVVRATGGTEANEEAIKTARAYTKRKKIIGFKDTYHGHSFGTMSLGYLPEYVKSISPMVGGFIQIDFPALYRRKEKPEEILAEFGKKLENILKKEDIAAIVTEADIITGWGSTYIAPRGYLRLVRKLSKKYGTLLILDEVGTGFSRCGKLFGMELEDVIPDIITFAKGISNGAAAIGAMVTTQKIGEETYKKTNIYSTFGWMPAACAAAIKTLEIHKRDKIWVKAKQNGDYLIKVLRRELGNNQKVDDIRGIGMEIGLDLIKNKKVKGLILEEAVIKECRRKGLFLAGDGVSNIQLMPPLTISRKDLDKGIEILIDVIRNI
jgi:4-aminobutyrate aminotransferase-like enzyme